MSDASWPAFFVAFDDLPDPRIDRTRAHSLAEVVVIAICAVLGGADSWLQIAAYGRSKEAWLRGFLELPAGIPSHDTFGRVFSLVDPIRFAACYRDWIDSVLGDDPERPPVIAIDGKVVRRSHGDGTKALHLISAWATESGVALGQRAVPDHANEITALPELLTEVVVPGAVITMDAMGCQRAIVDQIRTQGGDYLVALKRNQPATYDAVAEAMADVVAGSLQVDTYDWAETIDKGHGRLEHRTCHVVEDTALNQYLQTGVAGTWPGLRAVVRIDASREDRTGAHTETRYYLTSLPPHAGRLNTLVRRHWAIENELHWVLDVVFDEDQSRIRQKIAAQNFAMLRKIAITILKQDSTKQGIKGKRQRAGWDDTYLLHLLSLR